MHFFSELKRRNVYKVAAAYAVVGWLVIQVSSTVLPTFHAPEWVVQALVVLVAVGFPIALVIAATLNDKELAFSWLERGLATGALGVFYKDEPIWDPIRDDPRFGVLVGKMVVSETSK